MLLGTQWRLHTGPQLHFSPRPAGEDGRDAPDQQRRRQEKKINFGKRHRRSPGASRRRRRRVVSGPVQIIHLAAQMRRPCFVMEISGKRARDLCLKASTALHWHGCLWPFKWGEQKDGRRDRGVPTCRTRSPSPLSFSPSEKVSMSFPCLNHNKVRGGLEECGSAFSNQPTNPRRNSQVSHITQDHSWMMQ